MTRFEEGKMYWMGGHGFYPVTIISRSKTGKTVLASYGNTKKPFRAKIRVNLRANSEYIILDRSFKEGSWQYDEVSCYACKPLSDADQKSWELHYETGG